MKKALFIFSVIYLMFVGQAQSQAFYPNPDLYKFQGTWQATVNGKVFRVILKVGKITMENTSMEILQGYHTFKEGSNVLQSSEDTNQFTLINGNFVDKSNKNKVNFLFRDLRKKKSGDVSLQLQNNDTALWVLTNTEGIRIGSFDKGFGVPLKATLKKVN